MKWVVRIALAILAVPSSWARCEAPKLEITNGSVHLQVYLPDSKEGFYRGTRFDWSGVIGSLTYKGHNYYGPWFTKTDGSVRDFVYDGSDIIAGPCSAITGPAEEFSPALGFDEAKAGGTFLKIGVGVLRKPDDQKYGSFRMYDLVDGGSRSYKHGADFVEFRQEVRDPSSGYGYIYTKTIRLSKGKPELVIEHTLKNVGKRTIEGSTYNHNFLVLDHQPPGPAFAITFPFAPRIDTQKNGDFAAIKAHQIIFLKTLADKDRVYTPVEGFDSSASDFDIRIENSNAKAGMVISGNRPLAKMALWAIRSVMAVEPFVTYKLDPGEETSWQFKYEYYTF
jgi:hypothetical protein